MHAVVFQKQILPSSALREKKKKNTMRKVQSSAFQRNICACGDFSPKAMSIAYSIIHYTYIQHIIHLVQSSTLWRNYTTLTAWSNTLSCPLCQKYTPYIIIASTLRVRTPCLVQFSLLCVRLLCLQYNPVQYSVRIRILFTHKMYFDASSTI